jgi:hypothetical protein
MSKPVQLQTYHQIQTGCIRPILEVKPDKMLGESPIIHFVHLVQDKVEQIKRVVRGGGRFDIVRDRQLGVIPRVDGVGGGENGCSGIQSGDDTCFRNGNGLLFLLVSADAP